SYPLGRRLLFAGLHAHRRETPRHALRRTRARFSGLSPRPLRRVQPGLRPGHLVRPSVRRPHGIHPAVDAAASRMALRLAARARYARSPVVRLPASARMALSGAIGLLGGSFDPVHLAHVALAQAALRELSLAQVQLLPAGDPWQRGALAASPAQRLAMLELAVQG